MVMASLPAPPAPLAFCSRGIPPPRRASPRGHLARAARSCYRFRTDDDGVVDVAVAGKEGGGGGYAVCVEVPSLPGARGLEGGLVLRPTGSGEDVPLAPAASSRGGAACLAAELSFDATPAPFYLSFLLTDAAGAEIRTHRKTSFRVPVGVGPGSPAPLGMSLSGDGAANFAVYTKSAEGVALCLYDAGGGSEPALEIDLDPHVHRTGNVWHVSLKSVEGFVSYGFNCGMRRPLLDPYAKVIGDFASGNSVYDEGVTVPSMRCLALLANAQSYNWGTDKRPCLPLEKLVVYRANVSLFTEDKSSGLQDNIAGTFSGMAEKIEHFRSLGVNAVLLEPVFPFDQVKGPYFPYHFFSPMNSYSSEGCSASAIKSMKDMVKAMHKNGIEVLLEVVFTHTAEGESDCHMISMRGIDNSSYYISNAVVGCKASVLNCNHPVTQKLILDSLHHWVLDFHVDGFSFINAPFLVRGPGGEYLSRPPLLEAIAFDPVLSKTKIIADPWSPLDISNVQFSFPHWKKWAEINTRFSIDVRKFLKREALISDLATRLCGSGDLFSTRGPAFSFNYVSRNSGLSLVDLVSFSDDDLASESSWNCGEEGPSEDTGVLQTRLRQIRNFIFILFVSLGIPVLNMGDECGHSAAGSVSYKDRERLNWKGFETTFVKEVTGFISFLTALRSRRGDIFQRREFLKLENIHWYGCDFSEPGWDDPTSNFLCMHINAEIDEKALDSVSGDLYICFNAKEEAVSATLPTLAEGSVWLRLVDTSLAFPGFFATESNPKVQQLPGLSSYEVEAHTCVLFESKRALL